MNKSKPANWANFEREQLALIKTYIENMKKYRDSEMESEKKAVKLEREKLKQHEDGLEESIKMSKLHTTTLNAINKELKRMEGE